MRVDVFIKLVLSEIEIDIRDIIVYLKNNNFFYFRIWKKRKITMILFNFELLMRVLMFKQYNIKFIITIKVLISDIELALFHIIFKNDVVNKKRFNFVNKSIFKSKYSDVFFDSNSIFSFNFDVSRKININIFNLWYARMNYLGYQNVQRLIKMLKDIDLIKKIVNKDLYVLCVIKKTH